MEIFNFLTSGLKKILNSLACSSCLEMGVNAVCTLKIDRKYVLLTIFLPEDKNKTRLSISQCAREVADDGS